MAKLLRTYSVSGDTGPCLAEAKVAQKADGSYALQFNDYQKPSSCFKTAPDYSEAMELVRTWLKGYGIIDY